MKSLPHLGPACPRCAQPNSQAVICGRCLHQPPERNASISLFPYCAPVDRLIADMKYHNKLFLSQLFAQQLVHKISQQPQSRPQMLIPIPLHPRRLRQRGYNQSSLLAHYLSKQLAIPVNEKALSRIKNTVPQASLAYESRQKNIQHAFKLNTNSLPNHIALVDDVLTTGHTADVAAKTLRRAGVAKIELWTIARTIRHDYSL